MINSHHKTGSFKHHPLALTGVHHHKYDPIAKAHPTARLMQQHQVREMPVQDSHSSIGAGSNSSEIASKWQQVISSSKDTLTLAKDSTEITETIGKLRQTSSTLKVTVETVYIREVKQLALYLDETITLIAVGVQQVQLTRVSSNAKEVLHSLEELSRLVGSRLQRASEYIVDLIAWGDKFARNIPSKLASKIDGWLSTLTKFSAKLPKVQAMLKGGIGALIGVGISVWMVSDKRKEYTEDPNSKEKYDKYVIEIIGLIVAIVLMIVGAVLIFFECLVCLVIGVILLIYAIVNTVFAFKGHQDLISERIHKNLDEKSSRAIFDASERAFAGMDGVMDQIKSIGYDLGSWFDRMISKGEGAISQTCHYIEDELVQLETEAIESVEKYVHNKVYTMLHPKLWL